MAQDLGQRVEALSRASIATETTYKQLCARQQAQQRRVEELTQERQELQKTTELFRFVIENKSRQSKKKLEHLLTFGLKTVFKDQDLGVVVEESMERNRSVLKIHLTHNGRRRPIIGSYGGGVVNVVAFVLRVLALQNSGMRPFMVLDEQFSMVSEEYIPNVAELIRKLCDKLSLDAMVITHKEGFRDYATRIYHMDSAPNGALRIKKLENFA